MTTRALASRREEHLRDKHGRKGKWIQALRRAGCVPEIVQLDCFDDPPVSVIKRAEERHIRLAFEAGCASGHDLLNEQLPYGRGHDEVRLPRASKRVVLGMIRKWRAEGFNPPVKKCRIPYQVNLLVHQWRAEGFLKSP